MGGSGRKERKKMKGAEETPGSLEEPTQPPVACGVGLHLASSRQSPVEPWPWKTERARDLEQCTPTLRKIETAPADRPSPCGRYCVTSSWKYPHV